MASTNENTTANLTIGQSLCPHPSSVTGIHAFALCWSSSENYYTVEFHEKNFKTEFFENLVFISKKIMNYMYEPGKPLKFRHISKNLKYGDIVIQILYYLAFLILAKYKKEIESLYSKDICTTFHYCTNCNDQNIDQTAADAWIEMVN